MTIWRGRRCRAAVALAQRACALGLLAVAVLAVPAMAGTDVSGTDDPRDVGTRLDLKTLTHAQDGPSIVYTAETYGPFSDQSATFKWGVDRDRDEAFDLIVFTQWRDGKLVGGVKDPAGHQIAPAAVSRPGPSVIRVSFPAAVLGGAPVYRYAVDAEGAPGDRDLAPDAGLVQHRLGAVAAGAKEVRTADSAPAAPAPAPQANAAPARAAAQAPAAATAPAPAKSNLPRTGPGDRSLLSWSGAALMTGGAFVALGARRNRVRVRARGSGGVPRDISTGGI
jgi:LPXTG-motif cell wall-anchored protein